MALPSIAPYPPGLFRDGMMPDDWALCLDSWTTITQLYLRQPDKAFFASSAKDHDLLIFLSSYLQESPPVPMSEAKSDCKRLKTLRRNVFLLCHRILLNARSIPHPLLSWTFLADLSKVYLRSDSLKKLLGSLWTTRRAEVAPIFSELKTSLTSRLDTSSKNLPTDLGSTLNRVVFLMRASHDVSVLFMTGSDFLDALVSGYSSDDGQFHRTILSITYTGLLALSDPSRSNLSSLLDHLYSLKATTDQGKQPVGQPYLLKDLCTKTPLLQQLDERIDSTKATRATNILTSLRAYRIAPGVQAKVFSKRGHHECVSKLSYAKQENYAQHMSLITQVQDLFPDLGPGFISRLLHAYSDSVETVTARLLDDSLPEHLDSIDRSLQLDLSRHPKPAQPHHLTPQPPTIATSAGALFIPSRRNIHDSQPLHLMPKSSVSYGLKNTPVPSSLPAPTNSSKSAILAALSLFDADDDERDDTYDAEDVGGTVDGTTSLHDFGGAHDQTLYYAFRQTPTAFGTDRLSRQSEARKELRERTGLTDESIEEWAILLRKVEGRRAMLDTKYGADAGFDGEQKLLVSGRWKEGGEEGGDMGHSTDRTRGGRLRGSRGGDGRSAAGRGRGRGSSGGGPSNAAAGPPGDKSTQIARQRKEQGRGRGGANHNRREGRAKKMARGGFPPQPST